MKLFGMNVFEKRAIENDIGDASAYGKWLLEQGYNDSSAGVSVNEASALGLPAAYACVNVLAQTVANIPLQLMKDGLKGPKPAYNHPLYDLMRFTPTDGMTSYNWRQTLEGHRNGWGNAYARIQRINGMPVDLEPWLPDRTEVRLMEKPSKDYFYRSDVRGEKVDAWPADVLHFKGLGFDGLHGYSPVQMHTEAIGLGLAIHKFGGRFFAGGLSPKGVITTEMAANQLEKYAEMMKEKFGGLDLAHGTPILSKGMDYKPLTINPDDAQTLETLKYNRTEICGIYRVPPQFIMDLQFNTFTNAKDANLHFVKHTMVPILTSWEEELNVKLLTESERRRGYYFHFDIRWFMRGDPTERATFYHTALTDGWLNRNEVRAWEDLEEEEGLDEFLTPTNMGSDGQNQDVPEDEGENKPEDKKDENKDDEEERMKGMILPLVQSLAEKMAVKERRTVERIMGDATKMADFYSSTYPEFIGRHLAPLAAMMEPVLIDAPIFTRDFVSTYMDRQMAKSVNTDIVSETDIVKTFYEVIEWSEDT